MKAQRWLLGILTVILSAAFISGVVADGSAGTQMSIYSVAAWPVYLLTYAWMKADARARGSAPPPGAIPLIPVLLPIAVPYYLLATRRRWQSSPLKSGKLPLPPTAIPCLKVTPEVAGA
jgi:hypothetical protein